MTQLGPYRDTLPKFLRNVDKRLNRLEHRRLVGGEGGGGGGSVTEVQVGPTQPTDPNVLLWFNTTNDTLYANEGGGVWTPIAGGGAGDAVDEVYVGVTQPSDPTGLAPSLELWYDPDATFSPYGYTFIQGVASNVWVINHPLPFQPNVTVTDSAGDQVEGEVEYTDADTITIRFTAAFAGTAYLS